MHSYHQGYYWTDGFQEGLERVLKRHDISHRVVYLDTKQHQSPEYLEQLYSLYKVKLERESFAAIVASDNNALNLLERLAPQLGNTPVIFSGINGYHPEMHASLNATGVSSRIEIKSNIELIKRLQPDVQKIFVITEDTVTGEAIRSTFNQYLNQSSLDKGLVKHFIPGSYEQLKEFVSATPEHSAIIFWGYDSQKNVTDTSEEIVRAANNPVYILHERRFGGGVVGGYINSGVAQGKSAGQLLVEVLHNPGSALPEIRNTVPELKISSKAVKMWNLRINRGDSVVDDTGSLKESFADKIQYIFIALLALIIIILALLYYLQRLKLSEQRARQSQSLLESIFDNSHQYICILDQHGRLVSSNNKFHELLVGHGMNLDRPIWQHKNWEQACGSLMSDYFATTAPQDSIRFETEIFDLKAGSRLLDIIINPLPASTNQELQYLMEGSDITAEKLAEQKLVERESNMRAYYEQQPVMMMTLDETNRIQAANRFTEELLGYRDMDILGHYLSHFYLDEKSAPARQMLLNPKQAMKDVWRREIRYRHKDGSTLWIRENIRPLEATGQLLIVGEDITEIHSLHEQLEYQARYDILTEAFNRNHFEVELEASLNEVRDQLRTHAMLYIDLDQLKVLNDTAGHEAGDSAIKFAATIIEQILPYKSVLARMGGDEFAVLLRDCTELDAKKIAKSIILSLGSNPFKWNDIVLNITCSIGIRLIDHTASSTQMIHAQADTACHAAKEEGRNRFHLYHVDDEDLRRRQQEMESVNLVHDALAKDRVELFAQRILSLTETDADADIFFEILVRIRDVEGEYISPGIFMPASEKYNVAHLIDKSVVTKTLAWFEHNPAVLERLGGCAINLSGQSMGNSEFIGFLIDAIEHSLVPAEKLSIEITETAAMGNVDSAVELFTRLKQLGCRISLDDFGSGLSSFGYLKKLPVDTVKIDGLFVRDMHNNETDLIMVRSINELAKQMGKKTVAEFVENTEILELLTEMGVDYAQGYVIARPKPLPELIGELLPELS
ncbi:EAL domain-containing protein [Vibrio sp. JC009]|nr:ABC transporter substrate binding protein [Vibrio sp. JC009]WED23251.1 EAL domain-containing protein [Vibrio sp. JC009]